jgi:putative nucleotidyltransferase with HDIG domain
MRLMGSSAEEIQDRLFEIKALSTLPHVMTRVMAVVADSSSSAKDLAREIRSDQALTSRILKVSNSAYYGFHRKISNIDDAVVVLGFDEIRSLCLAITVLNMFNEDGSTYFDRRLFWRHSVVTAVLSEQLAENYPEEKHQAFAAGLLHDMGRAVLDQYFPELFSKICIEVERRKVHWLQVERDMIGTDHCEIGLWVAERWNFPDSLTEAIGYHHHPAGSEQAPRLVGMIHLADIISRRDLPEPPPGSMLPPLDKKVYDRVALSQERVEQLASSLENRSSGVQDLIDILASV